MALITIANQAGALVRAALNTAIGKLQSNFYGATDPAPSESSAGMFWVDSSGATPVLKIRNAADDGWITIGTLASLFELAGTTAFIRELLDDTDAATARTTLGLGALATLSAVGAAQITDSSVGTAKLAAGERMSTGNVLAAFAGQTAGEVGSLVFALCDANVSYGVTVAGSTLQPAAAWFITTLGGGAGTINLQGGAPLSGAWRCLGRANASLTVPGAATVLTATLFVRVS